MKWVFVIGGGVFGTLLNVTRAQAHFQAAGLGNFNAGALHPLLTVQHALAIIAFGLLCGQRDAALLRFGLPGLAGGLGLGLAAANLGASTLFIVPALTVFAALAGLCVAANYVMLGFFASASAWGLGLPSDSIPTPTPPMSSLRRRPLAAR